MKRSPRQRAMMVAARAEKTSNRRRAEKSCNICKRSINSEDPVNPAKRLRWGYGNKGKIDQRSGEETMQGKVDQYCAKVRLI